MGSKKMVEKYDKSLEYQANTKTLIGSERQEYVNTKTGEVVQVDSITKRIYGGRNFWKCYLMDFLNILGIIDNKQVDIFIYIVENTNQSTNLFVGTYKKIAQDLGVSEPTIAKIFKKLQANLFVKKVQNGLYMVNPNILMKGNDHKRQILLSYYQSDEPIDKITVNRTKREALPESCHQLEAGELLTADAEQQQLPLPPLPDEED